MTQEVNGGSTSEEQPEVQSGTLGEPRSSAPPGSRSRSLLPNEIERQPIIVFLAAIVTAFCFGIGAYQFFLSNFDLVVIRKNSFILKEDLEGRLLRREATRELTRLIDIGQVELSKESDAQVDAWLLESRTFVHELGLPKDSVWEGQKVSNAERNMLWAIQDPSLVRQAQKTLGVLRGLRAAFSSREDQ